MRTRVAESLRDIFICMIMVVSENSTFDLRNILSYPITNYPLSLAHCDGTRVKSDKSSLMRKIECFQNNIITTEAELPDSHTSIYDGGLVLHSILSQIGVGASFASIARTVLLSVCSGKASEVHLCLDKYIVNSIKDSERELRGSVKCPYVITGPEQRIRQSGQKLLNIVEFKNEISKSFLHEWQKDHYYC